METPIEVSPKVWEDIHRPYVAEHIAKAMDQAQSIADMLQAYAETGRKVFWKDAMHLLDNLQEKAYRGALARVRETAYFVCEACDSDICEHTDKY